MPKIGAIVRSYGLCDYLVPVLKQFSWVDRLVVLNYRFNGVKEYPDKTRKLAGSLNQPNIEIDSGEGLNQHDVLNHGLSRLGDCEFVFISDSDELSTFSDKQRMLAEMGNQEAVLCGLIDYARDFEHIFPIRSHHPVCLVKPHVRFIDVRCVGCSTKHLNIDIHHFGYVHSKPDMDWKVDWERPWENNTTINLLAQLPMRYQMPEEIREMLFD